MSVSRRVSFDLRPRMCALLLLIGFVLGAVNATAEPAAAAPGVPDPRALDADWWSYFALGKDGDTKQLPPRYATFAKQLAATIAAAEEAQRTELESLRGSIDRHFGRYLRILQTPAPLPPAPAALKDSYPLDDVLDLGRDSEQLKRAATLEAQEISLLERSLARAQERLDVAKVRYRDLQSDAPTRLLGGVRLIRDRLRIETLDLELHWRRAHQAALTREIAQHATALAAARTRIEATDQALVEWQAAEKDARKQADTARADLLKLQLNDSIALATSDEERAQQRQHASRSLRRTTEIAVAETRRITAVLAQLLLQRIATDNASTPDSDRIALTAHQAQLEEQKLAATEASTRVTQLRGAIAVEQTAVSDQPSVANVYVKARTEIDTIEAALEDLKAQLRSAAQLFDLLDQRVREREGRIGHGVRMLKDAALSSWVEAHGLLAHPLFDINDAPVTVLGLVRIALILTAAWWLSVLLRGGLLRLGQRNSAVSAASLYAAGRVLHYLLLTFGFVIGLSSIGVDLTKFALFASALGVGVGFGLQTLISNFVAGLIILFEQSMNVGDFVELESGATGEVKEINMRATRITTNDNVDILVPNAEFMSGKVMNWTLQDSLRRIHIPFGVAYGTDKERVRVAALDAAAQVEHTLQNDPNREPQVWLVRFGESALDFELVVWLNLRAIKRPGSVISDYCWALETKLREHDIEIPVPQRELHIRRTARRSTDGDFSPL